MELTPDLREEYRDLFRTARVRTERKAAVNQIVDALVANRARYKKVGDPLEIPWWFVAVIHELESGRNFKTHLHNGDPLTRKTVNVPANRPPGSPPFSFEESARDALELHGLADKPDWSISRSLFRLERFNGFGYRRPTIDIPTPYLWSFCQHYTKGKFSSDGHFDASLVSAQCGAGVLLRVMVDRDIIQPLSTSAAVA